MKAVEHINAVKLPVQPISSFKTSLERYEIASEPRLTMVWQTEWRDGQERVFAKWIAE